jgi:hypothetical protein
MLQNCSRRKSRGKIGRYIIFGWVSEKNIYFHIFTFEIFSHDSLEATASHWSARSYAPLFSFPYISSRLILMSWSLREQVPPKRRYLCSRLHGALPKDNTIHIQHPQKFKTNMLRTSHLLWDVEFFSSLALPNLSLLRGRFWEIQSMLLNLEPTRWRETYSPLSVPVLVATEMTYRWSCWRHFFLVLLRERMLKVTRQDLLTGTLNEPNVFHTGLPTPWLYLILFLYLFT